MIHVWLALWTDLAADCLLLGPRKSDRLADAEADNPGAASKPMRLARTPPSLSGKVHPCASGTRTPIKGRATRRGAGRGGRTPPDTLPALIAKSIFWEPVAIRIGAAWAEPDCAAARRTVRRWYAGSPLCWRRNTTASDSDRVNGDKGCTRRIELRQKVTELLSDGNCVVSMPHQQNTADGCSR